MRTRTLGFAAGLLAGLLGGIGLQAPAASTPAPTADTVVRTVAPPSQTAPASTAPPSPTAAPSPNGAPSPACAPAPLPLRAAQLLVVGLPGVTGPADPLAVEVADVGVAGVLLTGGNVEIAEQVAELVGGLRAASPLPLLVATDEEPGRVSSFRSLLGGSPSARTLAARGTPADVRAFARELGEGLAGHGVDLDLAPVADVDGGPATGIVGDRSFSDRPRAAARYALAFTQGLADAGVLAAAKHFPGHGRSQVDSHAALGVVTATVEELRVTDLVPFVMQIEAGVPVVMTGHVAYTALDETMPASLAPQTYALLREMGFDGVAMTDSLGMGPVNLRWPFGEAAVRAVAAGADAVLATDGNQARPMRDALVAAVESGRLPEDRLDEAVVRMLALRDIDPAGIVCPS